MKIAKKLKKSIGENYLIYNDKAVLIVKLKKKLFHILYI